MSLRMAEIDQILRELEGRLLGAVLQKLYVPLPKVAYLDLRGPGASFLVCLNAEAGRARISLPTARFPSPQEPSGFQVRLRHELLGARFVAAKRSGRSALLGFERDGGARFHLVVELGPRGGRLVLLDEQLRVLALSGATETAQLRRGEPYVAPPESDLQPPSRLLPQEGLLPLASAAEALFAQAEKTQRAEEIRRSLLTPLTVKRARLERTIDKVRAEAERGPLAQQHRRWGELLAQNVHRLERGARQATLTEYTQEGPIQVEVELDPALPPKEQAERHFRRYRRLLRGCEHASRRLKELSGELARLDEELVQLRARSAEQLLERTELLTSGLRRKGPPQARPYKEFFGSHGARILVGKGARANEQLTFKIAKPHDLWLHARGQPGAHVVVPLDRGAAIDPQVLLDAAHLAVHYSGAKGEPQAEVSYTFAKFVRHAKGAPGQVNYTREKNLLLRVEPPRLARLLESRDEPGV